MDASEVKKILKNSNLVLGSERVVKLLTVNQLESAYLAKNAPKAVADDIRRYASLNGISCETLDVPNDELGVLCKKPFNVAVIGLKKVSAALQKKRH